MQFLCYFHLDKNQRKRGTFVVLNGSGSSISVYLNAGQTISLNVVAKDASGCTVGSRTVAFSRSSCMVNPGSEEGISFEKIQYQPVLAELSIFPNPTEGILNIYAGNCESLDIEVFSSVGQRLLYVRDQPLDSYSCVDLEKLPAGIYILRLSTHDGLSRNFKVLIEKQ